MNNGNGITEYAKDSMFPAMGAFGGYLFHNSIEYFGNPIVTAIVVYLTIFIMWVIIRTLSSVIFKLLKPKLFSLLKRAVR
jgi:hypothetical protein